MCVLKKVITKWERETDKEMSGMMGRTGDESQPVNLLIQMTKKEQEKA